MRRRLHGPDMPDLPRGLLIGVPARVFVFPFDPERLERRFDMPAADAALRTSRHRIRFELVLDASAAPAGERPHAPLDVRNPQRSNRSRCLRWAARRCSSLGAPPACCRWRPLRSTSSKRCSTPGGARSMRVSRSNWRNMELRAGSPLRGRGCARQHDAVPVALAERASLRRRRPSIACSVDVGGGARLATAAVSAARLRGLQLTRRRNPIGNDGRRKRRPAPDSFGVGAARHDETPDPAAAGHAPARGTGEHGRPAP